MVKSYNLNNNNQKRGLEAEKIVQKHLWSHGYRVRNFSIYAPFDLLVNDKIRVEVKTAKLKHRSKAGSEWAISGLQPEKFDVLAFIPEPFDKPFYILKQDLIKMTELQTIGKQTIRIKMTNLDKFTKSPGKIFTN